jgi:iron complex transport system substrate-binding protein
VTDEVGRRVSIPADVNRVVTLSADLAETVYALGLGDRLAGDSSDADVPPAAKQKPRVGGAQNPNLEAIVALHPDLVLASTSINRRATVDALERLGIAVYTSDPHTVRGMLRSFAHIADAMGEPEQGRALVARLQKRLDALQARLAERPLVHVLFVVWAQPLITIGQNTFIADSLRWAGAESVVVSSENWPNLSFEEVIRLQPDYIVVPVGTGGMSAELADLRARADWRQVEAVELGHVAGVSDAALRPSPGLIDAIEQLARELHPEAFADSNAGAYARTSVHAYAQARLSAGEGDADASGICEGSECVR